MKILKKDTIAAIDIGSNALRAVIAKVDGSFIHILHNYREALRLGDDVFFTGAIGNKKLEETEVCFIKLLHLFAGHNVINVKAVATSALRNAANKKSVVDHIKKITSIDIDIIDGIDEAKLIHQAVSSQYFMDNKIGLLIDIGGGSTEITITHSDKVLACKSFKIGTVRLLHYYNHDEIERKLNRQLSEIKNFVLKELKGRKIDICVGTGGNLRRIGKLRKKILYKASSRFSTINDINIIYSVLTNLSFEERMKRLDMRPDRADVIVPACYIIKRIMESINVSNINLPRVGLKEGILISMNPAPTSGFVSI